MPQSVVSLTNWEENIPFYLSRRFLVCEQTLTVKEFLVAKFWPQITGESGKLTSFVGMQCVR